MPVLVEVGVAHPTNEKMTSVRAVVDTGAAHSMLPESLLADLDIAPLEQRPFTLADGSLVEYGCGPARFHIAGSEWQCPVLFGPENIFMLGRSTLANFNLAVDPSGSRLGPTEPQPLPLGAPPPTPGHSQGAAPSGRQICDEIHRSMPEGAFDDLPTDGARNYKHYLYGRPKEEDEPEQPPAPDAPQGAAAVLQMIKELHEEIPEGALAELPTDFSVNLKHYLYGWPKEVDRD